MSEQEAVAFVEGSVARERYAGPSRILRVILDTCILLQLPTLAIGRVDEGVGVIIIGEARRFVVPLSGLAEKTNGDGARLGGYAETVML